MLVVCLLALFFIEDSIDRIELNTVHSIALNVIEANNKTVFPIGAVLIS